MMLSWDQAIFCRARLKCDASMFAIMLGELTNEGVAGEEAEAHALMPHGQDPWLGI